MNVSDTSLLELLNGGSIVPELLCLVVVGIYLSRESRRRGLRPLDWVHLPSNMDLMLALFICDSGIFFRSSISWAWRFFGAGDFNAAQGAGLVIGGTVAALGFLCKIRALTRPDYGDAPWLAATASSVVALAVLLAIR